MKKFLPIALMATVAFGSSKASILTANNSTTSPGQYTTLQAAITAAHTGDTILVSGSTIDYASNGTITINKQLTLWGTGYNLIKDNPVPSKISSIELQSGSGGTVIAGFIISNYIASDNGVQTNSITIKRNFLSYITDYQGDNWLIQENVFGLSTSGSSLNGNGIVVKNNIFQGNPYVAISNQSANTGFVFSNNLVFGNQNAGYTFYNAVVSNNIFYDSTKSACNYINGPSTNCSFSNNIVYGNPNPNVLDTGVNGNTGSGNRYNTNPMFTNLKIAQDGWNYFSVVDFTGDLTLRATSPGHNAGTDTRDIGLYGGSGSQNPLTGNPPIPQISTMNILNTVIAPGTTLNVQLKAKSNN